MAPAPTTSPSPSPTTANSAIVPLHIGGLAGLRTGLTITNGLAHDGQAVVVGREPVQIADRTPALTLFGQPGHTHAILATTNLSGTPFWQEISRFQLTGRYVVLPVSIPTNYPMFFRAVDLDGGGGH